MGVDILGIRGQYERIIVETWTARVIYVYCKLRYYKSWLGAFGTYSAMIRLLGEDLRLASCDGEVGLRNLEDLGIVQFTIIVAVTECLEPSLLSDFGSP